MLWELSLLNGVKSYEIFGSSVYVVQYVAGYNNSRPVVIAYHLGFEASFEPSKKVIGVCFWYAKKNGKHPDGHRCEIPHVSLFPPNSLS